MSLILDALRKSEHQRQREGGPGLAVVPESTGPRKPGPWTLLLGALLLLNLVVIAAVVVFHDAGLEPLGVNSPAAPAQRAPGSDTTPVDRPRPVPSAPDGVPATAEASLRTAPVVLPSRPPRDEVRSLTTETAPRSGPVAAESRRPGASPAAPSDSLTPGSVETGTAGSGPATTSQRTDRQASADARLPRFADLVVRGELAVPNMHIDIHVHSAVADERFVFINMRRYNEGQKTQEGPVVERIVSDGVVLEHQGQRFFMPRD